MRTRVRRLSLAAAVCLALSGLTVRAASERPGATRVEFVAEEGKKPSRRPSPRPAATGLDTPDARAVRVEFTATESETRPSERLRPVATAGIGFPKMDALNDYVDWINRNFNGTVDDIDDYKSYGIGLEHRLRGNWHAGVMYHRFEADTDGSTEFLGVRRRFSMDLTVNGGELYAKRVWPRVVGPVDLEALLGVGYYSSRYSEKEDGYHVSGHDQELGARAGLAATYHVVKNLDVFVDASYLWLKFDDYERGGRRVRFVSPGQPGAEADFGGFRVSAGLSLRF